MPRLIMLFLLIVFVQVLGGICKGAPDIISISGELNDGGQVVISGSGFGTKPSGPPVKWDNFDAGTSGQELSGWLLYSSGGVKPAYSNTMSHSGSLSGYANFENQYNCTAYISNLNLTTIFVSYWVYWQKISGDYSRNGKPA